MEFKKYKLNVVLDGQLVDKLKNVTDLYNKCLLKNGLDTVDEQHVAEIALLQGFSFHMEKQLDNLKREIEIGL